MESQIIFPDWEGSVYQKWSYNFCITNAWRVQDRLGDFDDCMAQCALYFLECKKFYEGKVNSPAQFMYMFKLWVSGQFHDLSRKDYRNRVTKTEISVRSSISEESDAFLAVSLSEASKELKEVLAIFFNAPQEILETLKKDAGTVHSGKFFRYVISVCGYGPIAQELTKELKDLLS